MIQELIRILSITDPETIEATVAENSTNAAQKTPEALSWRFGPIPSLQGT